MEELGLSALSVSCCVAAKKGTDTSSPCCSTTTASLVAAKRCSPACMPHAMGQGAAGRPFQSSRLYSEGHPCVLGAPCRGKCATVDRPRQGPSQRQVGTVIAIRAAREGRGTVDKRRAARALQRKDKHGQHPRPHSVHALPRTGVSKLRRWWHRPGSMRRASAHHAANTSWGIPPAHVEAAERQAAARPPRSSPCLSSSLSPFPTALLRRPPPPPPPCLLPALRRAHCRPPIQHRSRKTCVEADVLADTALACGAACARDRPLAGERWAP